MTETTIILTPEAAEEEAKRLAVVEGEKGSLVKVVADLLVITTDEQYVQAGDQGREIAKKLRQAEAERKRLKEPSLESGRRIDKFFADLIAPWNAALAAIKRAMGVFELKKEAERRALEEELRRKARIEQERLERLALANAERAEKAGHADVAEAVLNNVPVVPVPVVADLTPETKGTYSVTRWKARWATHWNGQALGPGEATRLLCKAVADGKVSTALVVLNEVAANKLAAALGQEMKVPGLEVFQTESRTFR